MTRPCDRDRSTIERDPPEKRDLEMLEPDREVIRFISSAVLKLFDFASGSWSFLWSFFKLLTNGCKHLAAAKALRVYFCVTHVSPNHRHRSRDLELPPGLVPQNHEYPYILFNDTPSSIYT